MFASEPPTREIRFTNFSTSPQGGGEAGTGNPDFYKRKLTLARYWAEREVPLTAGWLERAKAGSEGLMELDVASF